MLADDLGGALYGCGRYETFSSTVDTGMCSDRLKYTSMIATHDVTAISSFGLVKIACISTSESCA